MCFELHRDETPQVVHNFVPFKPQNVLQEDQAITWKSLILNKSIYVSPEGSTEVFEGRIKNRLGKYAIKIMYCRNDADLAKKQKESEMQISMKHPNICECIASFLDETYQNGYKFVIVMEFSDDGDIERDIEKRNYKRTPWPENELYTHITELIEAFAYLQDKNLTHGDVKPRNLYLTAQGKIKIGDFGESKQSIQALVTQTYQVTGTVVYFSPLLFNAYLDIIKGKNIKGDVRHNPIKSDVYSLGLSLLHMASLTKPTELNNLEIGPDKLQQNIDKAIAKLNYSETIKTILTHTLQVQENKRYDFKQLRSYINPSVPKSLNFNDDTPKILKTSQVKKLSEPKLISIFQTQGKANILDGSQKLVTSTSHRFQSSSRAIIFKDSAIITGGLKNSTGVFKINISTSTAVKMNDLNVDRSWHAMIYHLDSIFIIGGRSDQKNPVNSTEYINTNSEDICKETWQMSANLQRERENASAISMNRCIYVMGGSNKVENRWTLMDSIERYENDQWEELFIRLEKPSCNVGLINTSDKELLVVGGGREKGTHSNEIYLINFETGTISLTEKTLSESDIFTSNSIYSIDNKFHILGSFLGCFIFDKRLDQWELNRYK
jgi:serine/threonine protein kinase